MRRTRLAWFTPLSDRHSDMTTYSVDIVSTLATRYDIDVFTNDSPGSVQRPTSIDVEVGVFGAHDFVWKHARRPYDLTVYQFLDAAPHDFVWGYAIRYPGLAVLHGEALHHARAMQLLRKGRIDDYRSELAFDRPDLSPDVCELGPSRIPNVLYEWPLMRPVLATARAIVAHERRVASAVERRYPNVRIDVVRMGVPDPLEGSSARSGSREQVVFTALGTATDAGRFRAILRAFARMGGGPASLRLVGPASRHDDVVAQVRNLGIERHVELVGHLADADLHAALRDADVCICLDWPTDRGMTSGSWLRAVAAGKPTVVDARAAADAALLDPRAWTLAGDAAAIGVAVNVLDDVESLALAMHRLVTDGVSRRALGARARRHWAREHTMAAMHDDYRRAIESAQSTTVRATAVDLPPHFYDDGTSHTYRLLEPFGIAVDRLAPFAGGTREDQHSR